TVFRLESFAYTNPNNPGIDLQFVYLCPGRTSYQRITGFYLRTHPNLFQVSIDLPAILQVDVETRLQGWSPAITFYLDLDRRGCTGFSFKLPIHHERIVDAGPD